MKISYIVLYLEDTKKGMDFWVNKMGYKMKDKKEIGDLEVYKVGKEGDVTNFELVPLKIMENNPYDLNLGIPSLAFEADNLEAEHKRLQSLDVKVSDIIEHGGIPCFTVFDYEDNAFAVVQK